MLFVYNPPNILSSTGAESLSQCLTYSLSRKGKGQIFYPTCEPVRQCDTVSLMLVENMRLWVRDEGQFITYSKSGSQNIGIFAPVPWTPSPAGDTKRTKWHLNTQWVWYERNPEFKGILRFYNGTRHAGPLLQSGIWSLSSTAIHYMNVPGRIILGQMAVSASLVGHAEARWPMENCLPKNRESKITIDWK